MLRQAALLLRTGSNEAKLRRFGVSTPCCAKSFNDKRQGKIMSKLFGDRVVGSKKRWFPSPEGHSNASESVVFKSSQFGKPAGSGSGKQTSRRMTVLNKLFMTHITDLLATGEASEMILGRGMQVTRVKISSDFACINVYWVSGRETLADAQLEQELHRCSGQLRHELSQLALMGEVPRIKFVRDKTHANLANVELLLRNMDFGPIENELDSDEYGENKKTYTSSIDHASVVRNELFGHSLRNSANVPDVENSERSSQFPEMRHDVLGLDHRDIMFKILTKMRKSKQAWDVHNNINADANLIAAENSETNSASTVKLERIQQQLSNPALTNDKFDQFLAKRRERKNTPERKKYRRLDDAYVTSVEAINVVSTTRHIEEEDYLYEEYHENGRKP